LKTFILILTFLFSSSSPAQNQFQEFIDHVNSLPDSASKAAAIDSFMTYARTVGIPFIEDSTANFIYRGNVNSVEVPGDFNEWGTTAWPMTKLYLTNFWYRSATFEMDARLDYKFLLNGSSWILDPENPHTCQGGYGLNSELAMPLYIQPWEIKSYPTVPHGTILSKVIYSTNVGSNYQYYVYLPPGYDSLASRTYPAVYFQDGTEYITLGKAVNVIDNLLDSLKIEPVIAVFVTPNNRNEEYAGSQRNQYRLFFVNELVPYIDSHYKTKPDPKERLVLGDSFGGNISALISYNHPEVFGLCGLHSAAFWPNNYEAYNLIINGPVKDIKWNSVWGTYESLYTNLRSFRDFLISSSYEIEWLERPEGHSWGLWRASIDRILEYFYPYNSTGIKSEKSHTRNDFVLYDNYPNPFNPATKIRWQSPIGVWQTLKVYDILGKDVATLVNEYKPAGTYELSWNASSAAGGLPSGIYFYRLTAGDYSSVKKMILLK
jgi:enterochelin esterase family protein